MPGASSSLRRLRFVELAKLGFRADGTLPPYLGSRRNISDPVLGAPYRLEMTAACRLLGTTQKRRLLLRNLLDYRARLREFGVTEGDQWIGGSFCEQSNCEPHDIDLVTIGRIDPRWLDESYRDPVRDEFLAFNTNRNTKDQYDIDSYFFCLNQLPAVLPGVLAMHQLFAHTKVNTWKGFVAVPLAASDDEDEPARRWLDAAEQGRINATPKKYRVADDLGLARERNGGSPRLIAHELMAAPYCLRPGRPPTRWPVDDSGCDPPACLPLRMASEHGWDLELRESVELLWDGGPAPTSVTVRAGPRLSTLIDVRFGRGLVAFKLPYVFRTPPGWNLWVRGPVNRPRASATALEGIVETDWSVAPLAIYWKLLTPGAVVRFEVGQIIGRLVPQPRGLLAGFDPVITPLRSNRSLAWSFSRWNEARQAAEHPADEAEGYARGRIECGRTFAIEHERGQSLPEFRKVT